MLTSDPGVYTHHQSPHTCQSPESLIQRRGRLYREVSWHSWATSGCWDPALHTRGTLVSQKYLPGKWSWSLLPSVLCCGYSDGCVGSRTQLISWHAYGDITLSTITSSLVIWSLLRMKNNQTCNKTMPRQHCFLQAWLKNVLSATSLVLKIGKHLFLQGMVIDAD